MNILKITMNATNESNNIKVKTITDKIIIIVAAVLLLPITLYLLFFGLLLGRGLGEPDSWAWFGEYYSGVTGPIISAAAVWLVYRTYKVTQKQHRILTKQLRFEQNKQKSSQIQARLDGTLQEWNRNIQTIELQVSKTKYEPLRVIFETEDVWTQLKHFHGNDRHSISKTLISRASELDFLLQDFEQYCNEHDVLSDDKATTDFYRRRIDRVLERLVEIGLDSSWRITTLRAPKRIYSEPAQTGETFTAQLNVTSRE